MSVKLNEIVELLVKSAPGEELREIEEDLLVILSADNKSVVKNAIENHTKEIGVALNDLVIASKYNKVKNSSKFWDYAGKRKFNVDLRNGRAIDIEQAEPEVEYPSFYDDLVGKLQAYGDDHYPTDFSFVVVPESSTKLTVVLIGKKSSKDNFYTGSWKSVYTFQEAGKTDGNILLDIHYFEDGNVRFELKEDVHEDGPTFSASAIVNYINSVENKLTLKLVEDFAVLNNKSFKSLRRLLPVTKSKINWGKAIGNYRLGSEVVNKQ